MLVTRIAPTPSGFLHEGNVANMLVTAWWARACGGRLLLRIDDFDAGRVRAEYLADIFAVVAWLGLDVDDGPVGPADFTAHWSMGRRTEQLRATVRQLLAEHPEVVFVCACSRRRLDGRGRCVAGCRTRRLPGPGPGSVVRLHVPDGVQVQLGDHLQAVPAGDHVLWRRDDLPAYHLGSVVVDEALGVTGIVRGVDLLDSSALQLHLAEMLPAPGFLEADLRHHGLLTNPAGHKLSKSAGARAEPLQRTPALRARLERLARRLGAPLGISDPGPPGAQAPGARVTSGPDRLSWSGPPGS